MLEVGSNLKRATTTVEEDLAVSPEAQAFLASLPLGERKMESFEAEDLAESYETTYLAYAKYRWQQQHRFMGQENEEQRTVNVLSPNQIIRRLQKAGVDARLDAGEYWVDGIDHSTGEKIKERRERCEGRLWLHDFVNSGRIGISAWVMENGIRVRQCITHLQYPWSQEWSLLHFNEYDIPVGERRRGWRTAMLELILKGVLTEDEVNRAFGPVPLNGVSQLYRERLFHHRRKMMGLVLLVLVAVLTGCGQRLRVGSPTFQHAPMITCIIVVDEHQNAETVKAAADICKQAFDSKPEGAR